MKTGRNRNNTKKSMDSQYWTSSRKRDKERQQLKFMQKQMNTNS